MKKAVILGTNHDIQEGKDLKEGFKSYLSKLIQQNGIKAVAEEIRDDLDFIVAKEVCEELSITHKIIDPNPAEYGNLGITPVGHIEYDIMNKYEISVLYAVDTPHEALDEFEIRKRKEHHSIREEEWLKRILALNTWPVLVICGSAHFKHFSSLLSENDISVTESESNWAG